MGTGVHELKHTVKLKEWTARVAECRSSGVSVMAWCREKGIALKTYYYWEHQIVQATAERYEASVSERNGQLVRIEPQTLLNEGNMDPRTSILIRHGETEITLPAGSSAEMIAGLVKALNRHV